MFAIAPLDWIEWKAVLFLSAPVVLIDEVLKLLTVRLRLNPFNN
jgi:Ca2+ transporting ATPase